MQIGRLTDPDMLHWVQAVHHLFMPIIAKQGQRSTTVRYKNYA